MAKRVVVHHLRPGIRRDYIWRTDNVCSECGRPVGRFISECRFCGAPLEGREVLDVRDGSRDGRRE